jgi:hypothetical protein
MLLSTAAEAAAITTAVTQASKKAFIRILHSLAGCGPTPHSRASQTTGGGPRSGDSGRSPALIGGTISSKGWDGKSKNNKASYGNQSLAINRLLAGGRSIRWAIFVPPSAVEANLAECAQMSSSALGLDARIADWTRFFQVAEKRRGRQLLAGAKWTFGPTRVGGEPLAASCL